MTGTAEKFTHQNPYEIFINLEDMGQTHKEIHKKL